MADIKLRHRSKPPPPPSAATSATQKCFLSRHGILNAVVVMLEDPIAFS
jgi:hypothetical protein